MITLYGSGQSRSFRALWALEEAAVEYQYQEVKIGSSDAGGTRHPEYLKINCQGKAPTLVDGALILTESAAMVNYIAALAPEKQLMPINNPAAKARYDDFCFFMMSDLEQPLWSKGKHKFVLPEEHRLDGMFETAKWEFKRSLAALDNFIQDQPFVLGEQFSCADILLAQTLNWAERFEFELPEKLLKYRDRMYQREACIKALEIVNA
ncbi:glutathione S-transferase family protein [Pelagibaculum spongiae]|nr:glutathione S-transferase family protein [Pelagibaculum spongiae]